MSVHVDVNVRAETSTRGESSRGLGFAVARLGLVLRLGLLVSTNDGQHLLHALPTITASMNTTPAILMTPGYRYVLFAELNERRAFGPTELLVHLQNTRTHEHSEHANRREQRMRLFRLERTERGLLQCGCVHVCIPRSWRT